MSCCKNCEQKMSGGIVKKRKSVFIVKFFICALRSFGKTSYKSSVKHM